MYAYLFKSSDTSFFVEISIIIDLHNMEPIFLSDILDHCVLDLTADGGGAFIDLQGSTRRILGGVELLTKVKVSSLSSSDNSHCSHAFLQHSLTQFSTSCSLSSRKAYSAQTQI